MANLSQPPKKDDPRFDDWMANLWNFIRVPLSNQKDYRVIVAATDTLLTTDYGLIANFAGTVTLTLPTSSTCVGRRIIIKTITANTVVSANSDVSALAGGAGGTAILAATAGKFAFLEAGLTLWHVMMAN